MVIKKYNFSTFFYIPKYDFYNVSYFSMVIALLDVGPGWPKTPIDRRSQGSGKGKSDGRRGASDALVLVGFGILYWGKPNYTYHPHWRFMKLSFIGYVYTSLMMIDRSSSVTNSRLCVCAQPGLPRIESSALILRHVESVDSDGSHVFGVSWISEAWKLGHRRLRRWFQLILLVHWPQQPWSPRSSARLRTWRSNVKKWREKLGRWKTEDKTTRWTLQFDMIGSSGVFTLFVDKACQRLRMRVFVKHPEYRNALPLKFPLRIKWRSASLRPYFDRWWLTSSEKCM